MDLKQIIDEDVGWIFIV